MRPGDRRVRAQLAVARRPLVVVVSAGVVASLVVIVEAFALAHLVVVAVRGGSVVRPVAILLGAYLLHAAVSWAGDVAAARAASQVSADMRGRLARSVLEGRADHLGEGELTALATRGVTAAEPYLTRYLPALVLAGILPVLTVVAIASQDLLSAFLVLTTLPLIPVFGALVGLATRDRALEQWRAMTSLSGHFVDVLRGLPTLVAFRRAVAQEANIRRVTDRYRTATVRTLRVAFASSAVLELVATLSVALVAVVIGVRVASGHLDLATGLVVLLLAPEAYWPLRRVGAEFHASAEGIATFEAMSALGPAATAVGQVAPAAHRLLIADAVSYTYPGRAQAAVGPISLAVAPGSLTVVTGPSGGGKSTLLALIAGLIEPTTGSVGSGGVPADSDAWRGLVSWVPQRPTFVPGTVAANLRLADPSASDDALWSALSTVALAERIRSLGGLDADVTEDAALLSAGERARLALARAVLARRRWVLLDEPTAHLDPITRKIICDVIVGLAADAGVVVVSHDAEILALADRVLQVTPPASLPGPGQSTGSGGAGAAVVEDPTATSRSSAPPRFVLSTVLGIASAFCGVALTATAGWLIVKAAEHPAMLTMLVAIVGVRAFGLGRPVFRYAERLVSHDNALRGLADRRVAVYRSLVPLTPGRLGRHRGDVLASVVDDVDATTDRELRVRLPLRTYAVVTLLAVTIAATILPAAGVAIGATSALGAGAAYVVARLGTRHPERVLVGSRAELSALMLDLAGRADELRMWQAQRTVAAALDVVASKLARAGRRAASMTATARACVRVGAAAGVAAVAAVGAAPLEAGTLSAPLLALLLLTPVALADLGLGVVEAAALVERVQAAEGRLAAFDQMAPAVQDPASALPLAGSHDIELVAASLGWDGHPVLGGLDLRLSEGEAVGVIGPSGCGKSTLAATLIRFIDPVSGEVSLGAEALPMLLLDDVRGQIGYVSDDPHIFATTLVENIRLARPAASDAEVEAALRAVHLGDWLDGLPDSLDTWIGDGHDLVSGGERSRLGLARSILADQPVLVLDEPVAHLDTLTAERVAADLLSAARGRSVVWISHSAVGLDRVDRVLDLGGCPAPVQPDLAQWGHG